MQYICAVIRYGIMDSITFQYFVTNQWTLAKYPGAGRRPGPAESENAKNVKDAKMPNMLKMVIPGPGPRYFTKIHSWTKDHNFDISLISGGPHVLIPYRNAIHLRCHPIWKHGFHHFQYFVTNQWILAKYPGAGGRPGAAESENAKNVKNVKNA